MKTFISFLHSINMQDANHFTAPIREISGSYDFTDSHDIERYTEAVYNAGLKSSLALLSKYHQWLSEQLDK